MKIISSKLFRIKTDERDFNIKADSISDAVSLAEQIIEDLKLRGPINAIEYWGKTFESSVKTITIDV